MLVSNIKSNFTFENFLNFVPVLLDKLVAMVTLDNLGNQK